jgi:hypothetical protein
MNKDKKRVLRDYPNAIVGRKDDGSFIVIDGDYALAEEFFLPPALTEDEAWSHAALSCKTTQHFNRTHPMRLDLKGFEAKMARIEKRKRRSSYVR